MASWHFCGTLIIGRGHGIKQHIRISIKGQSEYVLFGQLPFMSANNFQPLGNLNDGKESHCREWERCCPFVSYMY